MHFLIPMIIYLSNFAFILSRVSIQHLFFRVLSSHLLVLLCLWSIFTVRFLECCCFGSISYYYSHSLSFCFGRHWGVWDVDDFDSIVLLSSWSWLIIVKPFPWMMFIFPSNISCTFNFIASTWWFLLDSTSTT